MEEKRVVIADAEGETRRQLAELLNDTPGLTVIAQTNNGEDLLDLCRQCDILVMDLMLAGMNGLEVLDRIRTWQNRPRILVMSNFWMEQLVEHCIACGADYFVRKPCSASWILRQLV